LFSGSVAQEASIPKPYDNEEAYQIYSALLPHEESYGFGKSTLIIQEDTVSQPPDTACFDSKSATRFKDALADYADAQTHKWLLLRQFKTARAYELLRSDTIDLFFKEKGPLGWQAFYKRYPESGGFVTMSPVGFNKTKTLAVVYTGSSCGSLCGLGDFIYSRRAMENGGKYQALPASRCLS
jgi:hypothetical protein